ncbi:MAG: hypothetical protein CMO49_01355 [Verrucomicrobiales bacterium]|nr:hypothetical protein [Verrucomicrobiales bacterium]|tara:strand:- start:6152 stop:7168 length:1017 start_codon:yes stop_codon:yes gene_type:complete
MSDLHLNNDYEIDRRLKTIVEPKKDQTFLKYFLGFSGIAFIIILFGMLYWQYNVQSYKHKCLSQKLYSEEKLKNSYDIPEHRPAQQEEQSLVNYGRDIETQESKIIFNDLNPIIKDVISKRENTFSHSIKSFTSGKTKGVTQINKSKKLAPAKTKIDGVAVYASSKKQLENLAKLNELVRVIVPFEKLDDPLFLQAVKKSGLFIIVDIPMEAKTVVNKVALKTTLGRVGVEKVIKDIQAKVPKLVGISNRMGSKFLGDKKSVEAFIGALSKYKLFFVHHRNGPYRIDQVAKNNNVQVFNAKSVKNSEKIKKNKNLGMMNILPYSKKNFASIKTLSAGK